jgi:hypothetical protein
VGNKPVVFTYSVEQRLDMLFKAVSELQAADGETRNMIPTKEMLVELMRETQQDEWNKLEKLRDDVVKLLVFAVEKGVYDQDELNKALE